MLHDSGIRECALEHCPDWVVKWAALTLEYIKLEENELPNELMSLPATRFGRYNELGAKKRSGWGGGNEDHEPHRYARQNPVRVDATRTGTSSILSGFDGERSDRAPLER